MKPPDRIPVVHGVEGRHLVDAHGRHLQQPRHLVHDTDAREAVLPLPEIEQRHHGRFFVLRWVPLEDLGDELLVRFVEGEGDGGVVLGGVAVLWEGGGGLVGGRWWVSDWVGGKGRGGKGDGRLGGLRLRSGWWW